MKWIVMPAMLASLVAFGDKAQAQSVNGCWHFNQGNVFSTVCFTSATGGNFNLEYALEDPSQGLVKGSCNGTVEITQLADPQFNFRVPRQEAACRQEDQVIRMAQRDYRCQRRDFNSLVCIETVYYDNGQVFSERTGLEYKR
ncbi:MAG: hypothetical protein ACFBRM_04670 [Pikeienuella sp.]